MGPAIIDDGRECSYLHDGAETAMADYLCIDMDGVWHPVCRADLPNWWDAEAWVHDTTQHDSLWYVPINCHPTPYRMGFLDGMESPFELGVGFTFTHDPDDGFDFNESYDRGVNFGQHLMALLMGRPLVVTQ